MMREEVGEHMAPDLMPFPQAESLLRLTLPAEAGRVSFNTCCYLMESMVPSCKKKTPKTVCHSAPNPPLMFVPKKALFSSFLTTRPHWKSQQRPANRRRFGFLLVDSGGLFLGILPDNVFWRLSERTTPAA